MRAITSALGLAFVVAAEPRAVAGCRGTDRMHDTDGYVVGRGAALAAAPTDDHGVLVRFGRGAALGVSMIGGCTGMGFGFDATILVLDGDGGRAAELAGGLMVSAPLEWPIVPFAELGGAAGRVRVGGRASFAVGPLVEAGLEGLVGRHITWRLGADAIGAGDGIFAAELGVGWTWPM